MSHRRSAGIHPRIHNPRMRRRASWPLLSELELKLLMAGLHSWEQRSLGPARTRIRRKRREVVAFYCAKFGGTNVERLWAGPRLVHIRKGWEWLHLGSHNPRLENLPGVLWHET
jgi:hypothetical protein